MQDIVLALLQFFLVVALVPSVLGPVNNKPDKSTSLFTAVVLVGITFIFLSLGLVFSSITTGLSALLWGVMYSQKK